MVDAAPILRMVSLTKQFGRLIAVNDVSLDIQEGEFFTIVGPSGSGKTTLLRMLGGLEKPTAGDIYLREERVNSVPANRRPTCMVFQSLALFNHKTVGQNIEFSLKMRGESRRARRERGLSLMKLVQLPEDFYDKSVTKCSGGERQRVALARALASDPDILFFDEPLSAIDYRLRKLLEVELKDLHRTTGKTFVYITHSLEEAMVMSDRIGIMQEGRLIQIGSPNEIYLQPAQQVRLRVHGRGEHTLAVQRRRGRRHRLSRLRSPLHRARPGPRASRDGSSRDPARIDALPERSLRMRRTISRDRSSTNMRSAPGCNTM